MIKILYGIQGTGNGHISRALVIIPLLKKLGMVDVLLSGTQSELKIPFDIKYLCKGLSIVANKNGGINLLETYKKSSLKQLYADIKKIPVADYDLVISDFEPVTAWACKLHKKACIGLSHQAAVMHKNAPKPKYKDLIGTLILNQYAPVTMTYGFHFQNYANNIHTPVISNAILECTPTNDGTVVVYLPAYDAQNIIKVLKLIKQTKWVVFTKNCTKKYTEANLEINPISTLKFIQALINCDGVLTGAGFETPAEVLYLKKKLMVIPMKGQFEQQCNAVCLNKLGVPVLKKLNKKQLPKIEAWLNTAQHIKVDYPNDIENILSTIVKKHSNAKPLIVAQNV